MYIGFAAELWRIQAYELVWAAKSVLGTWSHELETVESLVLGYTSKTKLRSGSRGDGSNEHLTGSQPT